MRNKKVNASGGADGTPDSPLPTKGLPPDRADPQIPDLSPHLSAVLPYRVAGRVRHCRGALLVCEGLDALVGLGDACYLDRAQCNPRGCASDRARVLAEVVAIDEAGVHLLRVRPRRRDRHRRARDRGA